MTQQEKQELKIKIKNKHKNKGSRKGYPCFCLNHWLQLLKKITKKGEALWY